MKKALPLLLALLLLCCAAGAASADELLYLENPTLTQWSATNSALQLTLRKEGMPVDLSGDNGVIAYYEKNVRTGVNGERVADGGTYSEKNTYMLGMGAGVDREDLWYVTMTYNAGTDLEECYNNTVCMLLAFDDLYVLMAGTEDEAALLDGILGRLTTEGSVGFQVGGKVLMRKDIGGQFIIGVDSVAFYDAFYPNSLEEYYNFDE